jgi:hypothetical protein
MQCQLPLWRGRADWAMGVAALNTFVGGPVVGMFFGWRAAPGHQLPRAHTLPRRR